MKKGKEYHITLGKGDVGRYVLLPGDPGRVPLIAKSFENAKEMAFNREYRTFTGNITGFDGKKIKVSATSTGIGCPSTAIAVEELIKIGADTFIRVGTAGSLQKNVKLGDIVISTASVREEGTTRQYVPLSYPSVADLEVTNALIEAAAKLGFKWHAGINHCKDAFYTENAKDLPLSDYNEQMWKTWCRSNVLSTSMESSAIFVISAIRKVYAGEVLAIIGLTYSDKPIIRKVGIEEAIKTAIEAIKILDNKRKAGKCCCCCG
ncbi:MAG: nucleoside phosphorylase [Elusimicrobia bacterium]|nr:nucleoside phosphorylase [Elusimicrobiota bacterium]